jgi:5'-nucleotidase (lipoprotein e(P4) family)
MRRAVGLMTAALLAGCSNAPGPQSVSAQPVSQPRPAIQPVPKPQPPQTPPTMQYLYGSGEAAALSIQAYNGLVGFARTQVAKRPADGVILAESSTLDAPSFVPCGNKPFAAVFDVDETMILNLGYEWHGAQTGSNFDSASWGRWEKSGADKVAPVPGALAAVNALRQMGVTVIFNTNRSSDNAAQTAAAIKFAGFGDVVHRETLFLAGDDAMGSKKDGRRATIAAKYCVIALGGDQLGDFTDLFNQDGMHAAGRRMEAMGGWASPLWGRGWFVLPNPVYGSGLKGTADEIFPMDKRWTDSTGETK